MDLALRHRGRDYTVELRPDTGAVCRVVLVTAAPVPGRPGWVVARCRTVWHERRRGEAPSLVAELAELARAAAGGGAVT